jgi:hypothetical protein
MEMPKTKQPKPIPPNVSSPHTIPQSPQPPRKIIAVEIA